VTGRLARDTAPVRTQYHFHTNTDGRRDAWEVTRLIEQSRSLRVTQRETSSFGEVDQVYWFDDYYRPTVRQVIEHAGLIRDVETHYPVITAADGRVMDGMHRVARAIMDGRTSVDVVRFETDPEPTYLDCRPDTLPYLRPGEPDDAAVMSAIEQACGAQFREAGRSDLADMAPISVADATAAIERGEITVAYRRAHMDDPAPEVVGWIRVESTGDEPYINQVCVAPDQQGHRIGSLLLRSAALDARVAGRATMILNTERHIAWNQPLYEHLGWSEVPQAEWTDQMQHQCDYQSAAGLDWSTRVHLRLTL
jgi:GNAT superfamily N-acetyltransferase